MNGFEVLRFRFRARVPMPELIPTSERMLRTQGGEFTAADAAVELIEEEFSNSFG
jgi:hypothetical protein